MIVMKILPPLPRARAYIWTNGCGAFNAKTVSRAGVQKRKSIAVAKPKVAVATALVRMPFAAVTLTVVIGDPDSLT
jgi:hypothetical protein